MALVAQSGALGLVLSCCVEEAGSGYSHFVSVGNEATPGATEIARHLIDRDEVGVVLMYLEALRDPANQALTAARAAELGKRVVLLNAGRSEAGKCAALSNSGGAVLADQVEAPGRRVIPLAPETRGKVAAIGMIGAGDSNPIDIGGGWEAVLHLVKPTLDALVVYFAFGEMCVDGVVPIASNCSKIRKPVTFINRSSPQRASRGSKHRAFWRYQWVRVGIEASALKDTLAEMAAILARLTKDPHAGLIVQPMVASDGEIGVGALNDPQYGPVVLIGPGGVGIEQADGARDVLLLNTDRAHWDAHAARIEARYDLVSGGVRPVLDAIAALVGTGAVTEIDVNPMIRTAKRGLMALDVLVVATQP